MQQNMRSEWLVVYTLESATFTLSFEALRGSEVPLYSEIWRAIAIVSYRNFFFPSSLRPTIIILILAVFQCG